LALRSGIGTELETAVRTGATRGGCAVFVLGVLEAVAGFAILIDFPDGG
jgi:hypothetical protein